jgi:hypothetical protein
MEPHADSFSLVEYLSIFSTFIYGYVATRFFSGWGAMINFRQSIHFSKEHFFWTLFTFVLLIDIWWGSWIKGNFIHQYFLYYLSLLPPLVFYLISVLLFPPVNEDKFLDLKKYFDRIRKRFYFLIMTLYITFEIGRIFFKAEMITDMYFNLTAICFSILGLLSRATFVYYFLLFIAISMLSVHLLTQESHHYTTISGGSFSLTEYLTIFIAFIYGAIASRFLAGWGVMISKFEGIIFSKEHFMWSLLLFGLLIDFWIGSWEREQFIAADINYFILSLIVPMSFYGLTAVLFPVIKGSGVINLKEFYTSHKKMIFMLFGLTILLNAITASIMEAELMDKENVFRLLAVGLAAVGYFAKTVIIERIVLSLGFVMLLIHALIEFLSNV